jgi:uncharacterized glyoxalase superfamily protein PhnB
MSAPLPLVLNQVNLVVTDMAASIAFYRRFGLTVEDPGLPEWARHHATVLMPGGIRLEMDSEAFARQWNPGWKGRAGGAGCVLFFGVSSRAEVDRVFESVTAAGYAVEKPPEDAFWGARYAIVEDPDGNPVGIMSPIDPARRRPPPDPPR